jgi:hypothetical protein
MEMKNLFKLIFCLALVACERDITLDLPQVEPKIVLNSISLSGDTIKGKLQRSKGIEEIVGDFDAIANASVNVYRNGVLAETVVSNQDGDFVSIYTPTPGEEWRISVSANGYTAVGAQSSVPAKREFSITNFNRETLEGNNYLTFTIQFTDPGNEKNYYSLRASKLTYDFFVEDFSESILNINTQYEPILQENVSVDDINPVFSDDIINGKTISIRVSVLSGSPYGTEPFPEQDTGTYYIYLNHITEDIYTYQKTLSAYQNAFNDFFSERVKVIGNVNNGFGIFGFYTHHKEMFEVKE